jgi:hypothetical protein
VKSFFRAAVLLLLLLISSSSYAYSQVTLTIKPSAPVVVQTPDKLLQPSDLVYQGAFRLPQGQIAGSSFEYGGSALAFNPANGSLFMVGHPWQQQVAEVTVPAILKAATVGELDTAKVLQPFADLSEGRMSQIGFSSSDSTSVGGLLAYRGKLYESAFLYYDGTAGQIKSHFVSGLDLSVAGDVSGPCQVGTDGQVVGQHTAGFVDGWMTPVPASWQAALGGSVLAGQCCLPIISRTSLGPAAFAIDPERICGTAPAPAVPLLYYTGGDHSIKNLGGFNSATVFTQMGGAVFPQGTRSLLFFGRIGQGPYCYGEGTADPSLAGTRVPGHLEDFYCFDPAEGSKGPHGYPYIYFVWAYDALDLAAAKRGDKQPWDVQPYAMWPLTLPFAVEDAIIQGATYDPATGRIFLSEYHGDAGRPLVHVLAVRLS